ncbi:MAG: family 10 glycosylhydrolase [Verrucomicrobiales bacterium]
MTYNIWNRETAVPAQPDHPFLRFPDWLSEKYRSSENQPIIRWDGGNYPFDQGHPAVQQHVFEVAMDIVRRYDVDGLHFDYLRYSDDSSANNQPWGYHPVSVARFNATHARKGVPLPTDPAWLQWRLDQLTALLRKTYLHCLAEKPRLRVSSALICYDPAHSVTAPSVRHIAPLLARRPRRALKTRMGTTRSTKHTKIQGVAQCHQST